MPKALANTGGAGGVYEKRIWLLTVAMLLSDTLSHAQSVDPALVGSRLIRVEQAGNKVRILLEIAQTGEYSLARVNEERGFITTDPESWHLNSPEMSHGKYSVKNADACSINSTISPGDWIELERVPAGNQRSRVDPSLLPEDMNTPQDPLNLGLVGLRLPPGRLPPR